MLAELGKRIHVRIPVIPNITDANDNFDAIGRFVSGLPKLPHVELLRHHPTAMEKYTRFKMERRLPDGMDTPSRRELGRIASRLSEYGLEVSY
jgi:pyruvate formate lyase activating enzyme